VSRFGVFNINGKPYDLDDLTLDEVEAIEDRCGGAAFSNLNFGSAKTMKAIAFTLLSRDDPNLAYEDVGKVRVIDLAGADEEMPDLPPDSEGKSPNGSEPAASGVPPSAASIAG
jgi:hypothetical protein